MENYMKKNQLFMKTLALLALLFLSHTVVLAVEDEKSLGVSKPENKAKIIRPSDVSKADIKNIKNVAVLVSSTLPLFGEVAENFLIIKLKNMGFNVTQRSKLSDMTQKELMKGDINNLQEELKLYKQQIELEKKLENEEESLRGIKRLENQVNLVMEQLKKLMESPQKETLDVIEIGRKLNLDAAIICTLFEGKRQLNFPKDKPPTTMETIVVSTFYLQMIDVKTERILLSIMLQYDKGGNLVDAVDALTKFIQEERK